MTHDDDRENRDTTAGTTGDRVSGKADNYAWLDEHSVDPRTAPPPSASSPSVRTPAPLPDSPAALPPLSEDLPAPPAPPTRPAPIPPLPPLAGAQPPPTTAPLPPTSPDGSITYTSAGSNDVAASYGTGPSMQEAANASASSFTPPAPPGRTPPPVRVGGARGRSSTLSWIGRMFQWRILVLVVGGVIMLIIGLVTTRGTTTARGLDAGDCFEIPEENRVDRVTDQDCAGPHEAEVYAEVSGTRSDASEKCIEAFEEVMAGSAFEIPFDAEFAILEGTIRHHCIIESPSASLVGSILD